MRDAWWSCFLCNNIARMTLQGWVYNKIQPTCEMHWSCIDDLLMFLCDNIARAGLQNTTNMRDAWWLCFRCNNIARMTLQGWVYNKTQPTCEMHDDRAFVVITLQGWHCKDGFTTKTTNVFFVTTLQGWAYTKTQPTYEMHDYALMIVYYGKDGFTTKHNQRGEQNCAISAPYLTTQKSIREYLLLGNQTCKFAQT